MGIINMPGLPVRSATVPETRRKINVIAPISESMKPANTAPVSGSASRTEAGKKAETTP